GRVGEQQGGIDALAEPAHADVQMRSGGSPAAADLAQRLSALDFVAFVHRDLVEMEIHADESVAVIDVDRTTGEEMVRGEHDLAVGDSLDRIAHPDRIVATAVQALVLAVEQPLAAEVVGT